MWTAQNSSRGVRQETTLARLGKDAHQPESSQGWGEEAYLSQSTRHLGEAEPLYRSVHQTRIVVAGANDRSTQAFSIQQCQTRSLHILDPDSFITETGRPSTWSTETLVVLLLWNQSVMMPWYRTVNIFDRERAFGNPAFLRQTVECFLESHSLKGSLFLVFNCHFYLFSSKKANVLNFSFCFLLFFSSLSLHRRQADPKYRSCTNPVHLLPGHFVSYSFD